MEETQNLSRVQIIGSRPQNQEKILDEEASDNIKEQEEGQSEGLATCGTPMNLRNPAQPSMASFGSLNSEELVHAGNIIICRSSQLGLE